MLEQTRLRIPAMDSAEATRKVSDALVNVQGVADIGVNPDERRVEVRFDPEKTDPEALRSAVRNAGFPFVQ